MSDMLERLEERMIEMQRDATEAGRRCGTDYAEVAALRELLKETRDELGDVKVELRLAREQLQTTSTNYHAAISRMKVLELAATNSGLTAERQKP